MDTAQAELDTCLKANADRANDALNAVQPAVPLPANIGASGANLSGFETSIRDGALYINYLVPDFLINVLNRLNGAGDILKPALEDASKRISDTRYVMARTMSGFQKTFDFALIQNAQMANDFSGVHEYVVNKILKPIDDMRTLITNLAKGAAPLLLGAPPDQATNIFWTTIPVLKLAIKNATDCIEKMGHYTSSAVFNAHTLAGQTYNVGYYASGVGPIERANYEAYIVKLFF